MSVRFRLVVPANETREIDIVKDFKLNCGVKSMTICSSVAVFGSGVGTDSLVTATPQYSVRQEYPIIDGKSPSKFIFAGGSQARTVEVTINELGGLPNPDYFGSISAMTLDL